MTINTIPNHIIADAAATLKINELEDLKHHKLLTLELRIVHKCSYN